MLSSMIPSCLAACSFFLVLLECFPGYQHQDGIKKQEEEPRPEWRPPCPGHLYSRLDDLHHHSPTPGRSSNITLCGQSALLIGSNTPSCPGIRRTTVSRVNPRLRVTFHSQEQDQEDSSNVRLRIRPQEGTTSSDNNHPSIRQIHHRQKKHDSRTVGHILHNIELLNPNKRRVSANSKPASSQFPCFPAHDRRIGKLLPNFHCQQNNCVRK